MYRELLLGCGYRRERLVDPYEFSLPEPTERWTHVTTVDINPNCQPDFVMDLDRGFFLWAAAVKPNAPDVLEPHPAIQDMLRFKTDCFDEVHAYEVLEHLGRLGDERTFFAQFDELWRMLKPDGYLCATVPSRYDDWLWADPGHKRAILPKTLWFLQRPHYAQLGSNPSSDYRSYFVGDFEIVRSDDDEKTHTFVLKAIKPARGG